MNPSENRQLNTFSLAALLVSAHYGLGFLLGTGEKALTLGTAGSLYAVSLGLGTIALLALAQFYWREVEQIWTLLGNRYGTPVKFMLGLMSWSSLIGIESVQIIAGAFILKVVGIPVLPSMVALAIVFAIASLLPVEKASLLFQGLLVLNILALLYSLWVLHGLPNYLRSPFEFIPALSQVSPANLVGISLSTILLVLIDMKYQQFVVQAKDVRSLYQGCLLAGLLLLSLAFLPSSVVIVAQNAGILPPTLDGKETIPYIFAWIGGGADQPMGILLILALIVPALGVGSSVLRMQNKTVLDLGILPTSNWNRFVVAGVNASLGLAVALKGGTIINLIVLFYATYVSAALVPFVAYLLAQTGFYTFSVLSVRSSLIVGSLSALTVLLLQLMLPGLGIFGSAELSIMIVGIGFGILGLLGGQVIEKYFPVSEVGEEV